MPTNYLSRLVLLVAVPLSLLISGLLPPAVSAADAANSCKPNTQDITLVGVWESSKTSMGGLGMIMEFREDGGWVDPMGAIVDSPGKAPSANVGVQKLPGTTGFGVAYMYTSEDGVVHYREPFPKPWGCYEVRGSKLRLCAADCPAVETSYKVTPTTLELTRGKGKQILKRVDPVWYHALNDQEAAVVSEALRKLSGQKP